MALESINGKMDVDMKATISSGIKRAMAPSLGTMDRYTKAIGRMENNTVKEFLRPKAV